MDQETIQGILARHIPEQATAAIAGWLIEYRAKLTITPRRKTVLGNYRSPYGGQGHHIRVNSDLNCYAFLLTLVHELAHLVTWEKHRGRVKPHGNEWKAEFKTLMKPFLVQGVFPEDVSGAIRTYLENPAASSCRDEELMRTLRRYDEQVRQLTLDEIAPDMLFRIEDGRIFKKGEKLRKNYRCVEQETRRTFRISASMPVEMVEGVEELES